MNPDELHKRLFNKMLIYKGASSVLIPPITILKIEYYKFGDYFKITYEDGKGRIHYEML